MHRVPTTIRLLGLFTVLSKCALLSSCSPQSLEEEALEIIESNDSSLNEYDSGLERSPDGLQFTRTSAGTDKKESVGFTENGTLAYKGRLKNEKADGEWSTFYPDGRLRWQGMKENGISNGPFTMWYPDGKVKMRGQYKDGVKDGKSTIFHMNGAKWREQWHEKGKPVGIWKNWNEVGKLVEELNQSPPEIDRNESSN
jgi:antitoxin component YwqK of YwqJK toxin-antitoxin module